MLIEKTRTWAEIYPQRLKHNLNEIKRLSGNTEIMAVVKADAYGHGDSVVAGCLRDSGISYYAVSNIDEALSIRAVCPKAEILILGYTHPSHAAELAAADIIQGIISSEYAAALSENALNADVTVRCHVKLDTGMGRVGLRCQTPDAAADEIVSLDTLPALSIEGIYTHFCVADSDASQDKAFTLAQRNFTRQTYLLACKRLNRPLRHMHYLNSAGLCYGVDSDDELPKSTLVRAGIIMYGLLPNYPLAVPMTLEPVMELKTVIAHIKTVHAGETLSYGRTFVAEHDMRIATLPVGYADGYPRQLSSNAEVLVGGKRCAVTGRVCMDQLMCDVTGTEAKIGDIVTLFGTDGDQCITADELAAGFGSIGYELVCGISKRVPRIIV